MRFLDKKGFTMVEMVMVVAIMLVLISVAVPSFNTWTRTLKFKEVALDISSQLRLGRQLSVTNNLEYRVECDLGGRRYRLTQGNMPSGSTAWTVVKPWTSLDANVNWTAGAACSSSASINIILYPNGSSDSGTVCIQDSDNVVRFQVNISPTSGRAYIY